MWPNSPTHVRMHVSARITAAGHVSRRASKLSEVWHGLVHTSVRNWTTVLECRSAGHAARVYHVRPGLSSRRSEMRGIKSGDGQRAEPASVGAGEHSGGGRPSWASNMVMCRAGSEQELA